MVVNTATVARISNRSVRERKSDVLLVVLDGDSEAVLRGSHRAPARCHPLAKPLDHGRPTRVGMTMVANELVDG